MFSAVGIKHNVSTEPVTPLTAVTELLTAKALATLYALPSVGVTAAVLSPCGTLPTRAA